jgi:type II secretory pathway pseudopilin PulG
MADFNSGAAYGYNYSDEYTDSPRINGLEVIVILLMVIAIIISGFMGYSAGSKEKQDEQKYHDISEIIKSLDFFYANNQAYPIRQCSEDLNPIDFEYTLRRNLTGQIAKIGTQSYIKDVFPQDLMGDYTASYDKYIYNLPCPSLIQDTVNKNNQIYSDGSSACNYNRSTVKTTKNPNGKVEFRCYLYTSSVNGDRYSLGYYSEVQQRFVIVTKFRTNKSSVSYS